MTYCSKRFRYFRTAALVGGLSLISGISSAQVDPAAVSVTLPPGGSTTITKTITVPNVPTNVEICLVSDVSGSFSNDLVVLKDPAVTAAITSVVAGATSAMFGLATFADYPISPYGVAGAGDTPYSLISPLTDAASWTTAINTLNTTSGGDGPESQLDGIVGAAVGLDPYGGSCGWSSGLSTTRIIIATTDASCHEPDAVAGKPHQNTTADVISTLQSEDITFIGLASGADATACFQPIADATGGVVEPLSSDGSNIATAIENAIEAISYDIVPEPSAACSDLSVTYEPLFFPGAEPGDVVTFTETITYTGTGADVNCEVAFNPAGTQSIVVTADVNTGGGEGCTPGYWKQKHHFDSWSGYTTGDSFNSVFGVGPNRSLLNTLKKGGGKFTSLNRHAVAALLNSSNPDVSYDYTTTEVIQIVSNAYSTGNWIAAKALLESANEQGCPLN